MNFGNGTNLTLYKSFYNDSTTLSGYNNSQTNTTSNKNGTASGQVDGAVALSASYDFRIINCVVGVVGFLLNSFVILMLLFGGKRNKSSAGNQHSSSNFHVICQSFIDGFVAILLLTTTLWDNDGKAHYQASNVGHQILCRLWLSKGLLWTGYTCSTYSILSLNFERYVAIIYPIFHKNNYSRNRLYSILSLSVSITIGGGYILPYIIGSAGILADGRCTTYSIFPNEFTRKFFGFLTFFFLFFIPLTVIILFYARMILALHRRVSPQVETKDTEVKNDKETNRIEENISSTTGANLTVGKSTQDNNNNNNNEQSKVQKNKEKKQKSGMERARDSVFKTSALLSISFVVCWSSNQIYYFMFQLGVPGCNLAGPFYDFTVFMIFVNCIVYPIIFLLKNETVQKNMMHLFDVIRKKNDGNAK